MTAVVPYDLAVLTSVLPGLREVRTPLTAGVIWLLVVWLVVAPRMPENAAELQGVPRDLWRLSEWAGRPATVAALSVVAYVVGLLSEALSNRLVPVGNVLHRTWIRPLSPGVMGEQRVETVYRAAVVQRLYERIRSDEAIQAQLRRVLAETPASVKVGTIPGTDLPYFEVHDVFDLDAYEKQAWDDIYIARFNLIGKEPELDAATDRQESEAEFRLGITLPLTALVVLLAVRWEPWFLVVLPGCVVLLYLGIGGNYGAREQLAYWLRSGRLTAPGLERVATGPLYWSAEVRALAERET